MMPKFEAWVYHEEYGRVRDRVVGENMPWGWNLSLYREKQSDGKMVRVVVQILPGKKI